MHVNLCGYNEVVMLRRLSDDDKTKACSYLLNGNLEDNESKYDPLVDYPHNNKKVRKKCCK